MNLPKHAQVYNRLCRAISCDLIKKPTTSVTYNNFPVRKMSSEQKKLFEGRLDRFNGVTVFSEKERCDVEEFKKKLTDSLTNWKATGKRGIWFRVHLTDSEWVPVLAKNGFKFHHAKDDYVMMYNWLPEKEACNIPNFAHTMVGVGAVVINENRQILVVSEKYFIGDTPFYKLPGGYVEPGENLADAAIREVFEETGIQTTFDSLLTIRQGHVGMFGCSDLYSVFSLKPSPGEILKCDREILECKWMDVDEYLNHPKVHELNRFFVQKYLEYSKCNIKIDCYHGLHQLLNKPYTVYHVMSRDETTENEQNNEKTTSKI